MGMITAETVRRINAFRADGYPVVSVYVGVSGSPDQRYDLLTRVSNLLHQVRPLAGDPSLGRAARMSVHADLDRIEAALSQDPLRPGAVAVFGCAGRGLFEKLVLPRRVRDRIVVDASPWVRPLEAVLDEYHRCAAVLVDRRGIRMWELWQGDIRERHPSDRRFDGYDLLVVGGRGDDVDRFLASLAPAAAARVTATFTVDPALTTMDDIRHYAEPVAERYAADAQRRWVAGILSVADSGAIAVRGVTQCLQAASVGAIRDLVVEDHTAAAGVVCEACGWLGLWGRTCAACGCPVRQSADVIDDLVESVIDQGGSVHRIRVPTPLAEWTAAATLRFPLRVEETRNAEIITSGQAG
jgi:Bacterial archaeo-eukaryotic release factor family 10